MCCVDLCGYVFVGVLRGCGGARRGPDAHDLVDPLSATVGVDRPHVCYAHDLIDPLSAAVGDERPDAHVLLDRLLSAAVGVDMPHAHDPGDPLSARVGDNRPHAGYAHDLSDPYRRSKLVILITCMHAFVVVAARQRQPLPRWGAVGAWGGRAATGSPCPTPTWTPRAQHPRARCCSGATPIHSVERF